MSGNEIHDASQRSYSLKDVKQDAEINGLTAALESLTSTVEDRFREEFSRFEKKWAAIEGIKTTEEIFGERCSDFLDKLVVMRGKNDQANEVASALYHPSYNSDFSRIFRRAGISGNVRSLPSASAGNILIDLILSIHLLEIKWIDSKSVGAFANATNYLGSHALTERFWVEEELGAPLVSTSFTDEKGLLDKAYKKVVHAIFLYEGFFEAKEFVLDSLDPNTFLKTFSEEIEFGDAKTLLQEYSQELGLKPPSYHYERDPNSPDHDPVFRVSIKLPNLGEISIEAKSKKEGSKKLAEVAIIRLKRDVRSRGALMRLLAKKSDAVAKERRPISTRSLPKEVLGLANEICAEFGIRPDYFRLMQALKTKSAGRSDYDKVPDNETISRVGAFALEYSIISSSADFRVLGIEGVHPRICDRISERFKLRQLSRSIYKPLHEWGVKADRQMAQALLFALFINEQGDFFGKMRAWLRAQDVFSDAIDCPDGDRKLPELFDERFSYVTVLQEYVQQRSPVLPTYSKITLGPTHAATHTAICEYEGNSTKGSSSRFVWAKNAAAFEMLQKLGYLEVST